MKKKIEIFVCEKHRNLWNITHPCPLCVDVAKGVYEQKIAEANAELAEPPLCKPCLYCEQDFYKKKTCSKFLWNLRKFCSPFCAGAHRARHTKTE